MQSFIVLGLIPGTHIQITFQMWIGIFVAFIILVSLPMLLRKIQQSYLSAAQQAYENYQLQLQLQSL